MQKTRSCQMQFMARLNLPVALLVAILSLTLPSIFPSTACAQQDLEDKRQLEHEDYAKWKSVRGQALSNDGKWISYSVSTETGDPTLYIRQIATEKEYSVLRGRGARFSFDSNYVLYTIAPDPEEIKRLRKARKKPGEMPKSKLEILNLKTGKHVTIRDVASFSQPAEASGWVAFKSIESDDGETVKESKSSLAATYEVTEEGVQRQSKESAKKKAGKKSGKGKAAKSPTGKTSSEKKAGKSSAKAKAEQKKTAKKKQESKKKDKRNGTTLVLRNLETHMEQRIPFVVNFRFSEDGKFLAYTTSSDQQEDGAGDGVHVVDLDEMKTRHVMTGLGNYGQIVFSKDGKQVAFMTDHDDYSAEKPMWAIYHWSKGKKAAKKIADHESKGIPQDWIIANSSAPLFSENGKRILFNTRPKPEDEEKEDENDDEKKVAKLDIWHWQDPFLQPQQLLQAARERNRSYRALYDISSKKVIQVASQEIPNVNIDPRSESNVVVGSIADPYNKMLSWDVQGFSDWHLIDLKTGESRLLRKMARGGATLSPAGKFIVWWDGEKQTWQAMPTSAKEGDEPTDLGDGIGQPLHNELHDTPSLPGPYGSAGWLADDKGFLIYDRWDIWQVDPAGKDDPVCLTAGKGREAQIRYRRMRLDTRERTIDLAQPQMLSSFVHADKSSGFSRLNPADEGFEIERLIQLDESLGGLRKARDSDAVTFTRSTFERYPDVWASDLNFKTMRRISRANQQQSSYVWGTSELVKWNADDGQELEGLLYKPEDFDPDKKYPLMVYFYERNSDNLHRYYAPAAGRSIINFSFYVSRGYVIFVPDIPYKTGEPGPSAANAILPGVKHVIDQGYIDEERVGMQGHSWGGYQTAYLVTMTDMFCCAESGAPVSNMTSAYGGIRWGTGMSRMFQYEKTQSRIGGTLWEEREKYIANSPVFFADKINTPLLILHNDEDTAVPWYQGIELFVAMRRLEKPAWMLNYNGDPHWVMSDENRMDFAKRMQQFFDHYMLGDPMPVWMADGIPAVDKGKKFGFEYVEETENSESESESETEESESEEGGEEGGEENASDAGR